MAAVICPTVTARTSEEYRVQMERLAGFARRVHIDLADGIFTHVKLAPLSSVWWPHGVSADLHVMFQEPFRHTKAMINLGPKLIVVHAEAQGDFFEFAEAAHSQGIQVGVALNPQTMPEVLTPALEFIDHVLIFSGHLGHFGGKADTHLLTKVLRLKHMKPSLEIGWDGGINDHNASILASGGVDVLNTGGFIHHAPNPKEAFHVLEDKIKSISARHKQV